MVDDLIIQVKLAGASCIDMTFERHIFTFVVGSDQIDAVPDNVVELLGWHLFGGKHLIQT